ncbi:DUF2894 domain-containing protein [Robbsia sp. KACC 23696]|uniref:DUF2894 domain-containing protein n=1 Tax=Robbsia sp. KACC 23696 TaxID=3149231 RepID=UPI00325ABAEB
MNKPSSDDVRPASGENAKQPDGGLRELTRLLNERTPPLTLVMEQSAGPAVPRYPEMVVLPYFRQTWAALRLDGQMRRSLQYVPENAGPLNSRSLVHRALSLMQGTAPGYLQHLLAYVDELSNLSAVASAGSNEGVATAAPASGTARKASKTAGKSSSKNTGKRATPG